MLRWVFNHRISASCGIHLIGRIPLASPRKLVESVANFSGKVLEVASGHFRIFENDRGLADAFNQM